VKVIELKSRIGGSPKMEEDNRRMYITKLLCPLPTSCLDGNQNRETMDITYPVYVSFE
jgi:hypothetical protein